jgi:uncharacterized protein YndB with AHSA1/START domain
VAFQNATTLNKYVKLDKMERPITVTALVDAPMERVWNCWVLPEHITQWNQASADWHSPAAENDLRVGGQFCFRMEAKDGSMGFDFRGTYVEVIPQERIIYTIEDGRKVDIRFTQEGDNVRVVEIFEAENENAPELQQAGWQAILDHFARYTVALEP